MADTVAFHARIPEDLMRKIKALAAVEERSINAQVVVMLKKALGRK